MYTLQNMFSKIKFTIVILLAGAISLNQAKAEVFIDVPAPGSVHTGIGLIHGWSTGSQQLRVLIDGEFLTNARADSSRSDVSADTDTGFAIAFNYNLLAPGAHTIEVHDALKGGIDLNIFHTVRLHEDFLHNTDVHPDGFTEVPVTLKGESHLFDFKFQPSTQTFQIVDVEKLTKPVPQPDGLSVFQRESLAEVNKFRTAGVFCHEVFYPAVSAVEWDPQAAEAARKHAVYLDEIDQLKHQGRGGSNPGQRLEAEGVRFRGWAENAHRRNAPAKQVVQDYIDDVGVSPPGHCINIMDANMTHMGTAKAGEFSVQNFIVKT